MFFRGKEMSMTWLSPGSSSLVLAKAASWWEGLRTRPAGAAV